MRISIFHRPQRGSSNVSHRHLIQLISLGLCTLLMGSFAAYGQNQAAEKPYIKLASGYVQSVWQVGNNPEGFSTGTHLGEGKVDSRFGIRRGRFRINAGYKDLSAAFVVNMQDYRISPYSVFVQYQPRQLKGMFVKFGLDLVPFGFDLPYGSSKREFFERSPYSTILFPAAHDIGLTFGYKTPGQKAYRTHLTLGLMSGNGTHKNHKSIPDLLGRLDQQIDIKNHSLSAGLSGYYGFVPTTLPGTYLHRQYYGAHLTWSHRHTFGQFNLRGEFIMGRQVGTHDSPIAYGLIDARKQPFEKLQERPFDALMVVATERLRPFPIEFAVRYNRYNRNRNYTNNNSETIPGGYKLNGTSHHLIGGVNLYGFNNHMRLSLHYEQTYYQKGITDQGVVQYAIPLHMGTLGLQITF